jgi:SET domain
MNPKFQDLLSICVEHNIPRSEWLPVAAIIMKLRLVAEFNKKIINYPRFSCHSYLVGKNLRMGSALYLASSLVNHSCDPNMYQVYYGSSAVFRARRPIVKGEQLTCCYMEPALPAAFFRTAVKDKRLSWNYTSSNAGTRPKFMI